MLQSLAVPHKAETVYRAALQHQHHGVSALATTTGLTQTEVRTAPDEPAELALLKPSAQADGKLRPVSPDVGPAKLLASAEAQIALQQAKMKQARAETAAITTDHQRAWPTDGAIRLDGLDAIRSRLEELQRTAEFECLSLNPGGAHKPEAVRPPAPSTRKPSNAASPSGRYARTASATTPTPSPTHAGW